MRGNMYLEFNVQQVKYFFFKISITLTTNILPTKLLYLSNSSQF